MRQLHTNYSFNSSTRVLTLTGLNQPLGNLVSIFNATANKRVYSVDGGYAVGLTSYSQAANSTATIADASGMSNSDLFNVVYDDGNNFDPVRVFDSTGAALTYASTGTAGTPASDVISVQGISGGTPLPVRPRNAAVTVTAGTTSGTANTSAQALASSSTRQYLLIQNISDTDMYFNFGAAATTSHMLLKSGGAGITFESGFVPTDAVNVICSAASKSYYILSA